MRFLSLKILLGAEPVCNIRFTTLKPALGAGSVVADDVEDQRVVRFSFFLHGIQNAADFVVGVGKIGGIDLCLSCEELFLVGWERVPGRKTGRTSGQLCCCWNNAQLLLTGEGFFAQLIPSLIELALVLGNPVCWNMMRSMNGASGKVEKEGLLRRYSVVLMQPVNRVIGQILRQDVTLFRLTRRDHRARAAIELWVPLAVFAAHESVEIIEAKSGRPVIEGPTWPNFPNRCVVPLAKCRSAVAISAQDLSNGCRTLGPDTVISWIAGCTLLYSSKANLMVVAA